MKKAKGKYRDLYITEISYDTTEEELRQLFSLCGKVKSIQMVTDDRDNFKGAAYVRMGNEKETRDALHTLDGTLMHHRCIKVDLSRTREERIAAATMEEQVEKKPRRKRESKGRKKI